jgi:flagellar hook-basal body complex protein FliE
MLKIDFSVKQNMIDISEGSLKNKNKSQKISFSNLLNNSISQVNELLLKSEHLDNMLALGQVDNLHQVVIASQKAELALQYTMQIRNKILDAYHEIMRMSI